MSATKDEMLEHLGAIGADKALYCRKCQAIRDLIERSGDDKPGYPTAEEVEGALGELARFITYVEQDLARDCVSQGVWDALAVLRRAIGGAVKE